MEAAALAAAASPLRRLVARHHHRVECVPYRDLFTAYVEQLRACQERHAQTGGGAAALAASDSAVRRFKREADALLVGGVFALPSAVGDTASPVAASSDADADAAAASTAALLRPEDLPQYLASPLTTPLAMLPDPVAPGRRLDVLVASDFLAAANFVAPYDEAVRSATAGGDRNAARRGGSRARGRGSAAPSSTPAFGALYRELGALNHLRFVVPFTALHETRAVASGMRVASQAAGAAPLDGDAGFESATAIAARTALAAVARYFRNVDGARRLLPAEAPASAQYWHAAPPVSVVTFSQECDILVSLVSQRKALAKTGTTGDAVPALAALLSDAGERAAQLAKYMLYRNAILEQKAAARGGGDEAGCIVPVVVATRNAAVGQKARAAGVLTEQLSQFSSMQTVTLLTSHQGRVAGASGVGTIGSDCAALAKILQRRHASLVQRSWK